MQKTSKLDIKKQDKKANKYSKILPYFSDDTIASKTIHNLKINSTKKINKWNSLSNIITINAYD